MTHLRHRAHYSITAVAATASPFHASTHDIRVQTVGPAHPVIVLGLSGKPRDLINLERWKNYEGQLDVVKRYPGN